MSSHWLIDIPLFVFYLGCAVFAVALVGVASILAAAGALWLGVLAWIRVGDWFFLGAK